MSEIGTFTPEQARALWQDYQRRQQLQPHISRNLPVRRPIDEPSPHRVFVRNDSYEDCPPYACMQITGTEVVAGVTCVTITKPTDTSGEYLLNSHFSIAAGANGWAYRFGVVIALGAAPSAANVQYRPIVGEWKLEEGAGFFTVFGTHNAETTDPYSPAVIGRFAGDSSIVHGIVSESLGCGWYTIELADWTGARDTYEECDPFADVTGSGTESCGITLTIPASQLTGTGVFVEARDCGSLVIPLIVGTDCLLTNLGDRDTATGEAVWQIVNGLPSKVVTYEEEWDCCDGVDETGVETLLTRTPLILVGLRGDPITCGNCTY